MLTESCVIFFCRPEPFKALFCEVIYRPVETEREGRTFYDTRLSQHFILTFIESFRVNLNFLVYRSRRNVSLYFFYTRHS